MKNINCLLIGLIFLLSCSKDKIYYDNAPIPELLSITQDSDGVTLTWNHLIVKNFVNYQIYRYSNYYAAEIANSETVKSNGQIIATIKEPYNIKFSDKNINNGLYFYYVIVLNYKDDDGILISTLSSNFLKFECKDLLFNMVSAGYDEYGTRINLSWDTMVIQNFERYEVYRFESTFNSYSSSYIINNGTLISVINKNNQVSCADNGPFSYQPYIIYAVKAITGDNYSFSQNTISIQNNILFDFIPEYALTSPINENLLLFDSEKGKILQYDTDKRKIVKSLSLENRLFRPFISKYNINYELYVPTQYGKILIFNLNSLEKTQEISLNTTDYITSVVLKENLLFYTQTKSFTNYSTTYGYVLDRSTLQNIPIQTEQSTNYYYAYSDVNFYDIKNDYIFSLCVRSGTCDLIQFSLEDNKIQLKRSGVYLAGTNYKAFAMSSDTNYFIYDCYYRSINYDVFSNPSVDYCTSYLGTYGSSSQEYSDACMNGDWIYLSLLNQNLIHVYKKDIFMNTPARSISTNYPPILIRNSKNGLISLNKLGNYTSIIQFYK